MDHDVSSYSLRGEKEKNYEFFVIHIMAAVLMIIVYAFCYFYKVQPHIFTTLHISIPFNFFMAFVFYKRFFKKHFNDVLLFALTIEIISLSLFPILAGYSAISNMCYLGGVIALGFHMQDTKFRYSIYYMIIIGVFNFFFIEDKNLQIAIIPHLIITTIGTLQITIFRKEAMDLLMTSETELAKLSHKSFFAHHLLNPINNIMGVMAIDIKDKSKAKKIIENNINRIENTFKLNNDDQDMNDHLLGFQKSVKETILLKKIKKSVSYMILTLSLFYVYLIIHTYYISKSLDPILLASLLVLGIFFIHTLIFKEIKSIKRYSPVYLVALQGLFILDYHHGVHDLLGLSILLGGFYFTFVILAMESKKIVLILFLSSSLMSLTVGDVTYALLLVCYLLFFFIVVTGAQKSYATLKEHLVKELTNSLKKEKIIEINKTLIPEFNTCKEALREYIDQNDNTTLKNNTVNKLEGFVLNVRNV